MGNRLRSERPAHVGQAASFPKMHERSRPRARRAGRRRAFRPASWQLALLGAALLVGCGQSGPRLVPVTGVVTLDGNPVADAGVLFKPAGNLPPASATTDAQGKFSLQTLDRPGAVLGQHRVSVIKQETTGVGEFGAVGPGGVHVKWIVPKKYSVPETSGLTATVTEENRDFPLKLTSKQGE